MHLEFILRHGSNEILDTTDLANTIFDKSLFISSSLPYYHKIRHSFLKGEALPMLFQLHTVLIYDGSNKDFSTLQWCESNMYSIETIV